MSLKLFLFPTLIVLSVILIIWYIKPDVETILTQQETERTKQGELQNVERIGENIKSLTVVLDQKNDTEKLVKRYYPEKIDQERSLDVINFLAQQTGVVLSGVAMAENPRVQEVTPSAEVANADPFAAASDATAATESVTAAPESYRAQIRVMGTYPNLRNFFDRLYRTDRMRVVNEFSIGQLLESERVQDGQEIIPADFLIATLSLDFFYTSVANAGNALHQELFKQNTLELGAANQLVDFVNSPVGDLAPAVAGRPNPFQINP